MKYIVTAKDGNSFIAEKDGKRWIATKSNGKKQYFAKGYIVRSVKL
jgi:hypothetical protein